MNLLVKKIGFLVISGLVFLTGQYLRGSWFVSIHLPSFCHPYLENGKVYCNSPYLDTGWALITAGQLLALVGLILLFANERGFRKWLHVSYWFVPIAAFITIFLFPAPFFLSEITRDTITRDLGVLYVAITFVIALYTRWKYR